MDAAEASCRPVGRGFAEHGASAADLLAIEQGFVALDGIDDLQEANLLGLARQSITASHPFAGSNDSGLLELWEDLRDKTGGDTLQFGKIPAAQRRVS